MKRPGLTPHLLSATLFLCAGLRAGEDSPPKPAEKGPVAAPRDARPERARDLLKRFDKNGDRKLDEEERAAAREAMAKEQRAEQLKRFDKNSDGKIDDAERSAMQAFWQERRAQAQKGAGAMRADLVRRFDRNANGRIDDEEMPELERELRPRLEASPQRLARHDKNRDGKLDDEEWNAARATFHQWISEAERPEKKAKRTDDPPAKPAEETPLEAPVPSVEVTVDPRG